MLVRILAVAAALALAVLPSRAFAATGTIYSFTSSGSATLTFAASDMMQSSMAPTSGAASFTLLAKTVGAGTVTVTAPTITGASGVTIPHTAFTAHCTATTDTASMFTSSGAVRLSNGAVTCGTLAANKTGEVIFNVTLTLDDTGDANGFPADTYTSGTLQVTANVP